MCVLDYSSPPSHFSSPKFICFSRISLSSHPFILPHAHHGHSQVSLITPGPPTAPHVFLNIRFPVCLTAVMNSLCCMGLGRWLCGAVAG